MTRDREIKGTHGISGLSDNLPDPGPATHEDLKPACRTLTLHSLTEISEV